jgi:hypothetical protein
MPTINSPFKGLRLSAATFWAVHVVQHVFSIHIYTKDKQSAVNGEHCLPVNFAHSKALDLAVVWVIFSVAKISFVKSVLQNVKSSAQTL